ncbi:MAG: hypothetical protein QME68_09025, partial [Elusimicrobiota bacterium]|nr:hypothetical protein [Elusimicrobiota bacterium]
NILSVEFPSRVGVSVTDNASSSEKFTGDNRCLIIKLTYKNFSALLTSDASPETLKNLVMKSSKINILQIPQHGKGFNIKVFNDLITELAPEYLLASTNKNLPEKASARRTSEPVPPAQFLTKTYSTHKEGAVIITSDGKEISTKPFLTN